MAKKSRTARRFPAGPLLRTPGELIEPRITEETAQRVLTASVVTADMELLAHDFPHLSRDAILRRYPELRRRTPQQQDIEVEAIVHRWLLRHAALVSSTQAQTRIVNTPIEAEKHRLTVFRPPRYGRALVVSTRRNNEFLSPELAYRWDDEPEGLLDIKGAGIRPGITPSPAIHHNGLMYLGEALADLAFQRVIEAALRHSRTEFYTLPVYAVIALGFDVIDEFGHALPAGLQVRRAHRRPVFGADLSIRGATDQRAKFEIEMVLRHYGLTSCCLGSLLVLEEDGEHIRYSYAGRPVRVYSDEELQAIYDHIGPGYRRYEGVNVQLVREELNSTWRAQIVDFGHFEVRQRFVEPVVSLVSDRLLRWGGALNPDHPHYVQPVPELQLPWDVWGAWQRPADPDSYALLPGNSRNSRVDVSCFELARGYADGTLSAGDVEARLEQLSDTATRRWPALDPT